MLTGSESCSNGIISSVTIMKQGELYKYTLTHQLKSIMRVRAWALIYARSLSSAAWTFKSLGAEA
jgi:hypothetical protein